jgi:hypothetical protein
MASQSDSSSSKPAAPKRAATTTARKPAPARKPATARKPAAQSATRRATTTAKRSATVAGKARSNAARATANEAKAGANLVGTYAEKAVLVPVGAALAASDRVVEMVTELIDTYSTRKKTEAQLKRFERRGISARTRIEKEAKKARTRAEHEVSRRRKVVGKGVSELDHRREEATKAVTDRVDVVSKEIQSVAAKVGDTVKSIA